VLTLKVAGLLLGETGAHAPSVGLAGAGLAGAVLTVGGSLALAAGRRAVGWWLVGTGRAMLELARSRALDRVQFGRPLAEPLRPLGRLGRLG
jgi:hypothetical protein